MSDATTPRRRGLRFFLALATLVGLAAGGYAYYHHHRYKHVAVHDPGRVYRCAWVEADVMKELVQTYQAKAVLNLCRPGEMGPQRAIDERRAVTEAGAKLYELPMPESDDPAHPDLKGHLDVLRNPDNYPLIVHCQHGVNRTARVLAMYDILYRNMTAEESISRMPKFGRDEYTPLEINFARNFEKAHQQLYPELAAEGPMMRR